MRSGAWCGRSTRSGGDSAFGTWVYRIITNAAYEKIRRRPRAFVDISLDEVLPSFHENGRHAGVITDWSSSIDATVQTEFRAVLSSAIAELPAHYRVVTVLCDVEGLSMGEVADALGITVSTAKIRAHRARLLLRHHLSMFIARAVASVEESAQESSTCRGSELHPKSPMLSRPTTSVRNESRHRRIGCGR